MVKRIAPRQSGAAHDSGGALTSSPGDICPAEALGRVLRELQDGRLTDQSSQKMAELLVRFTIFAEKGLRLGQVAQVSSDYAALRVMPTSPRRCWSAGVGSLKLSA